MCPAFIITASIVVALLLIDGIVLWLVPRQFISPDDAYLDGHAAQVGPQISAVILTLASSVLSTCWTPSGVPFPRRMNWRNPIK